MMLGGVGTALAWRYAGYHDMVYEGLPGMCAGLLLYVVTQAVLPRSRA